MNSDLADYKQNLSCALEIHSFNRDVDEMLDRINEKALLLSSEDLGKDLPSVEALQRKQEEVERDMTALQNQLEVYTNNLAVLVECMDFNWMLSLFCIV